MTCDEVHWLSGEAIDRVLPGDSAGEFFRHLDQCYPCRRSYELELCVKNYLRQTLHCVRVPPSVRATILDALVAQGLREQRTPSFVSTFWDRLGHTHLLASGLVLSAVLVFLFLRPPSIGTPDLPPSSISLLHLAAENLTRYRAGELHPAMIASEPEAIGRYFRMHQAVFASVIAPPAQGEWYGAALTRHDGILLAHIICKIGEDVVYMFELPSGDAQKDVHLRLPEQILERLGEEGWCLVEDGTPRPVVVWREREIICAAASTMRTMDLVGTLAER